MRPLCTPLLRITGWSGVRASGSLGWFPGGGGDGGGVQSASGRAGGGFPGYASPRLPLPQPASCRRTSSRTDSGLVPSASSRRDRRRAPFYAIWAFRGPALPSQALALRGEVLRRGGNPGVANLEFGHLSSVPTCTWPASGYGRSPRRSDGRPRRSAASCAATGPRPARGHGQSTRRMRRRSEPSYGAADPRSASSTTRNWHPWSRTSCA